jgi:hypothetical protein
MLDCFFGLSTYFTEKLGKDGRGDLILSHYVIKPLTPELNPSAQRCLPRIFTGGFAY